MRRFLATTAIVAASLWGAPANAATTPWVFTDGVTGLSDVTVTGAGSHTDNVPTNNSVAPGMNLFTLNPGGTCSGPYCTGGSNGTVSELLTVAFSGLSFQGFSLSPFTLTGTYTAKYAGAELACAVGDGLSPSSGQTDCFAWTGATATNWSGTKSVSEAIGNTGAVLALTFHNATDWSISPYVTAQIIPAAATSEPGTLALLGFGLLGMTVFARRRHQ